MPCKSFSDRRNDNITQCTEEHRSHISQQWGADLCCHIAHTNCTGEHKCGIAQFSAVTLRSLCGAMWTVEMDSGAGIHCPVLHCTILHCTVLYCTALCCTAVHYFVLQCTQLYYTAVHISSLHFMRLKTSALQSIEAVSRSGAILTSQSTYSQTGFCKITLSLKKFRIIKKKWCLGYMISLYIKVGPSENVQGLHNLTPLLHMV